MSSITTVLFDLDGTLLPMDQEKFTSAYFGLLAAKLASHGYEPKKLMQSVWAGVKSMVQNPGGRTNEEAFWETFSGIYGPESENDKPVFEEFYRVEFQNVKNSCGFTPKSAEQIACCKRLGLRTALATNPLFPAIATESRVRWAGMEPKDFELITTYENSTFCKPNPDYYREVAEKLGVSPEECLMVGNDALEDLAAAQTGMQVFLLTDCLINSTGADLSQVPHGGFEELEHHLAQILC